ncbi:TM0106 family RecB-like putative nuclease [Patescibacteria group bacterium]
MHLTPSKLYNYIQCPHRVWRDKYGPQEEKSQETNPFVEMLWNKGIQHEENVVSKLGELTDISEGSYDERFEKTVEAMKNGDPLIYQGVIKHGDLFGIPDLLKKMPDGEYIPVDIKSGMALEGADEEKGDEGKPKKHYAVQLCLYSDVLNNLGFAKQKRGKIIDAHLSEVEYDLVAPQGPRTPETFWQFYEKIKNNVSILIANQDKNTPAMKGICKLCPWYESCKKWVDETRDLSGLFYVGRNVRDTLNDDLHIHKIEEVLDIDIESALKEKKQDKSKLFLKGLAESSLNKILRRATVFSKTKKPVLYEPISFPDVTYELYFDIENDPTQEFVYLHGVYERKSDGGERFLDFTAKEISPEAEKEAWSKFWEYIDSLPADNYAVYYYSAHEKTTYKKMQKIYPDVISAEKVEEFFENPNVIDLYKIVQKQTDWPLGSYGIKPIAQYLGFNWRDENPSGAASIEWFNHYIETKDQKDLERILIYNEDDCKATMVLKDALVELSTSP